MDGAERLAARTELARLVSEVSEDCRFSSWIRGVEFELWAELADPGVNDGRFAVRPSDWQRAELLRLATDLGEWPIRDLPEGLEGSEPVTLPLDAYEETFSFVGVHAMAAHTGGDLPSAPRP